MFSDFLSKYMYYTYVKPEAFEQCLVSLQSVKADENRIQWVLLMRSKTHIFVMNRPGAFKQSSYGLFFPTFSR